MKLRDLLRAAGDMCQAYPIEIVPIDRRIDHQIDVTWVKDYEGEGPEYEYDADTEKWEPFYELPVADCVILQAKNPDGHPVTPTKMEELNSLGTKKLDLNDEGWMISSDSLFEVRSVADRILTLCYQVEKAQEIKE